MSKFGIDLSHHNTITDWSKVKSQVDFAILKLGNIGDNKKFWKDEKFDTYYENCVNSGIPVGVYVYCYSNEIANAEEGARQVVEALKDKKLSLPIYIDMEDSEIKAEGKDKLTNICIAFNTIIENAGYWAGVYANRDWFDNYLNKDAIKSKYTTWIATYTSGTNKYEGEYDIWQNSSNGKIDGITGNVDTNYMYRDLMAEIGNIEQTNTSQTTKSIVDLANEVIAGQYGDGEARKQALGSLYNDVQAKVNEILNAKKELTYTVQKGDTLSKIASEYNTTYQEIAKKNGISNPNKIYVGQVLKI
jgi:GH25 family lysozyme M1 (1,4-beta-N-acetylmuramidase)